MPYTVDREIFIVKNFSSTTFNDDKLNTQNILCNIRRPMPILVVKVLVMKFGNLQVKYFTSENIPIYSIAHNHFLFLFSSSLYTYTV